MTPLDVTGEGFVGVDNYADVITSVFFAFQRYFIQGLLAGSVK
ncbi:MAG: hypothetical protein ACRD07_21805 [Acidimicrobiales bacterium]